LEEDILAAPVTPLTSLHFFPYLWFLLWLDYTSCLLFCSYGKCWIAFSISPCLELAFSCVFSGDTCRLVYLFAGRMINRETRQRKQKEKTQMVGSKSSGRCIPRRPTATGFILDKILQSSYHDVVLLPLSKDNITHLQKQSPLLFLHLLSAFTCFALSRGSASSELRRISAFGLRFSTPQQWAFRIHNNGGIDLGKQHTHALLRLDHQR